MTQNEQVIYVSSLAFLGMSAEEMIQTAQQHDYAVEFSSGLPYREDMEAVYLQAPVKKIPHNYFPAPAIPFVLNLASANPEIRQRSITHCIQGLRLAREAGAPFFSAHAGFCIDPDPEHLGRKLPQNIPYDREEHWSLFKDSLRQLLDVADRYGIDFLIENNVVAAMNLWEDGSHPLFCADAEDIVRLLEEMQHPRLGILLDTAHWKVSSRALSFDQDGDLQKIKMYIRGIHHSDNDGTLDTNKPIGKEYWFLPHLKSFLAVPHVLEVKKQSPSEIDVQLSLLQMQQ